MSNFLRTNMLDFNFLFHVLYYFQLTLKCGVQNSHVLLSHQHQTWLFCVYSSKVFKPDRILKVISPLKRDLNLKYSVKEKLMRNSMHTYHIIR